MTPLRVAHVANEPFGVDAANGVQHVVFCLARALGDLGDSVAVFTRDDRALHVFGPDSEPVRRGSGGAPPGQPPGTIRDRLLARRAEPALAEAIEAWRPDIVHFHSVHIPRNIFLASRLSLGGIPYCLTVHGALFPAALRRHAVKKTLFALLLERPYLKEARFVQALTPAEADVIGRHGVTRPIVVVPNGLPPDSGVRPTRPDALYAQHPSLRGQRVFMFLGRLDSWQKGLDLLVEGFAQAALPNAALVLVGPDYRGSRAALSTLADRLGILAHVVFLDGAFGEDRANLLAAADVFVHPSRWEGLSLSVLAAAAAGKASLITREADPAGELERARAAIVVEPTVSSIAAGLQRSMSLDRAALQAMGVRARAVAEVRFTWPSAAARLDEAYRRALGMR
jgi:glycosyltransferase involved in cell wall biosynthesis